MWRVSRVRSRVRGETMKFEVTRLGLRADDGEQQSYRLYRMAQDPSGLAVLLPGVHYGPDGPLLFYPAAALREMGWDTLQMTYRFQKDVSTFDPGILETILEDCRSAVSAALDQRAYPRLVYMGKSLGSGLQAFLCAQADVGLPTRAVYFTPPIGTPLFDPYFARTPQPAHLVLGTSDRFYDEDALDRLRLTRPFGLTLVDGADHAMIIPGDLDGSIRVLRRTTAEVVEFCLVDDGRQTADGG
jgi:predicted alpha/beta-hydrolase family hydrolase